MAQYNGLSVLISSLCPSFAPLTLRSSTHLAVENLYL